jgi:hypothetical protein
MRRIVPLAVALGIALSVVASGSSSALTPEGVLRAMRQAALAKTSVHWEQHYFKTGKWQRRWISDVGTESGKQIGILGFPIVGGKVHEELIDNTVYIEGNAAGLQDAIALTEDQATTYENQWISIPSDDSLYPETSDGLTLRSIVDDETPYSYFHGLKLVKKMVDGTLYLVVQSKEDFRASLSTLAKGGGRLPVLFQEHFGNHIRLTGTFRDWNETVDVEAPATSVPIATVRGG